MAVFIDRAIRRGLIAASIAVAGHVAPAFALEFGALHVRSHLNQPLDATVVLSDLDASERASLDVGIAPPAMFQRFGIRRSSAVDRIQIDTTMTDGGRRAVVHIATNRPVSEPFVDFLLQVESGNGSALREYTAMLNPASDATNAPPAPTRSTTGTATRAAAPSHSGGAATGAIHQVQPGETLWSIAAANTPPNATVAQTMLAIYRANRSAFNGNMSALSGHARLKIPRAARIQAVAAAKAEQRLVSTRRAATEASAKPAGSGSGADAAGKLAASGEAPPAQLKQEQLKHDKNPSTATNAESRLPNSGATSAETSSQVRPTAAGAFGKLSLPSDTPWPAPQATTQVSQSSDTAASATAAAPAASSAATSTTNEPTSDKPVDNTAAVATSAPKTTAKPAPRDTTPPPSDVSAPDASAWLSPRNLLLLVVVLALIAIVLRRLRERGYKPVELDREPPPESAAEAVETPSPSAGSTADAAGGAYRQSPAMATPPPHEAEPTPVPAAEARPTSAPRDSTFETEPAEESQADDVASSEIEAPYSRPPGISASEVETPESEAAVLSGAEEPEPAEEEPRTPGQDVAPMRFEPVNAPEAGLRLPAHRRAATNEEIEALAFEAQSLPDMAERQHDRGDGSEPVLEFIETDEQAEPAASEDGDSVDEVRRPDPYGLEMIDPGEFDLYDPPSDTAGPTDDDPNHSVEIRLDLARMYIEMDDDQAARELLVDVRERGDDQQRDEAGRLLERLDA